MSKKTVEKVKGDGLFSVHTVETEYTRQLTFEVKGFWSRPVQVLQTKEVLSDGTTEWREPTIHWSSGGIDGKVEIDEVIEAFAAALQYARNVYLEWKAQQMEDYLKVDNMTIDVQSALNTVKLVCDLREWPPITVIPSINERSTVSVQAVYKGEYCSLIRKIVRPQGAVVYMVDVYGPLGWIHVDFANYESLRDAVRNAIVIAAFGPDVRLVNR